MFAILLYSTQDIINDLINDFRYPDLPFKISSDLHNHNFTSISQVKDVKETDCYYLDVQSLIEEYGIDITNKDGLLAADETINVADAAKILKKCWNLTNFDPKNYDKTNTTKANFIILFYDALNEFEKYLEFPKVN